MRMIKEFWWNITNIIRWIPILWNNFDWDYAFLLDVMEYKLQRLYDGINHYQNHLYYKRDLFWINISINLINKIKNDYYSNEMHDYHITDWDILEPVNEKDNLDEYFRLNNNLYNKIIKEQPNRDRFGIAVSMASEKHNKAKNLLFKILNEHIEEWWD
jgi:hypothetical protein